MDDRNVVKQTMIPTLLAIEPKVQQPLIEALSIIAIQDFPKEWPSLVTIATSLVDLEHPQEYHRNLIFLRILHAVTKPYENHVFILLKMSRWRSLSRTDTLFTTINAVLQTIGEPYLKLTIVIISII